MTNRFSVIPLAGGDYCVIVDACVARKIRRYAWYCHKSRGKNRNEGQPYARAKVKGKNVYLHRFLTECPPGYHVDHKNHQTLDCRMVNLEIITNNENQRRRRNVQKGKTNG